MLEALRRLKQTPEEHRMTAEEQYRIFLDGLRKRPVA